MTGINKVYGPIIANLLQRMAVQIQQESKATAVRIACEFTFKKGALKGQLKMQSFTTPDAQTERLLDPDKPMAKGAKLQHQSFSNLKRILNKILGR